MKIYLPNRNYLIPSLSVDFTVGEENAFFPNIFTDGKIGYIGEVAINYTPTALASTTNTGQREFATVSFDLSGEPKDSNKYKLFWSNFGYVGKQAEKIYYVFIPNISELVSKLYKSNPSDSTNWASSNGSYGFAVDKINGVFVVIIDPYDDLVSEIDFLIKMFEKFTVYGSLDNIEKIPASTIRMRLQNIYNLLATSQITQSYEIYSFDAELWSYQLVWTDTTNNSAVFGLYGRLVNPDLDNIPFNINFVAGTNDNCVMLIENIIAGDGSGDTAILQSFVDSSGNYIAEAGSYFRNNTLLFDGTNYLEDKTTPWSATGFLSNFITTPNIDTLFNLAELVGINNLTSLHDVSIIGASNEKQKSIFEFMRSVNSNLYSLNPALTKLYQHDGSVMTKTWGGTPKATITSGANDISDLYDTPPSSSSPVLYSFISNVILDTENDFVDPSYLDFWFVSTPGVDMLDSSNIEIFGLINTLIETHREGDSIYLFDLYTEDSSGNKRKFEDVLNNSINNLISTPHGASTYPDVIITHPIDGSDTVVGGGTILLIKLGQLEKIWRSPAGSVRGLVDFAKNVVKRISKVNADNLYTDAHINPIIKPTKVSTFQIEGNRTLYKKGERVKSALSSLNVKTTIMYLIRVLREVLYTFKFEPNTPGLFLRFQTLITPELDKLLGENAIYSYKIADLTTDNDRNQGRVVFAIGIQPTREAEIIIGKIYIFPAGVEITFEGG